MWPEIAQINLAFQEMTRHKKQITRNRRGEALLLIENSRISLSIHSSSKEYEAISTAAADLRARMERN